MNSAVLDLVLKLAKSGKQLSNVVESLQKQRVASQESLTASFQAFSRESRD